jgi:ArsR family transcriptional regulator, lead/cadmium/zinc/bismuth-responsive transcriptional repressor
MTSTVARAPTARPRTRRGVPTHVRRMLDDPAAVERLARTFRALGDPSRSRLVLALSAAEMCVSDLARTVGASLSATSHQLRVLRDLDIVRVRRDGRSQLYLLNEHAFGFCAPRLCHAWQQAMEGDTLVRPRG